MAEYLNTEIINQKIQTNAKKLLLDVESRFRGQLFTVAGKILDRKDIKVVLLAGPSCAGKTTSAKLLKEVLEKQGKHVVTISMDDFFIDRDKTPYLSDGTRDLDSPNCVNTTQLEECFSRFFSGKKTKFPVYDFITGKNIPDSFELKMKYNTIIIFEGLHVLNPEITAHLGTDKYYKIYVSALSGFEHENEKMSPTNLRLLRRMIRDVDRRNLTPETTLKTWDNVCEAETKYITPYMDGADYLINTTHEYELGVFKSAFHKLMKRKKITANKYPCYNVLNASEDINREDLPDTSLMWEFVDKPEVKNEE